MNAAIENGVFNNQIILVDYNKQLSSSNVNYILQAQTPSMVTTQIARKIEDKQIAL